MSGKVKKVVAYSSGILEASLLLIDRKEVASSHPRRHSHDPTVPQPPRTRNSPKNTSILGLSKP